MIFLKDGVELQGKAGQNLHPVWSETLIIIEDVFEQFKSPTVITSAFDGKHMVGSLHYVGRALDFRNWFVPAENRMALVEALDDLLGLDFDLLNEGNHFHFEIDPE